MSGALGIAATHWRAGGRWYGWRSESEVPLVVELWVPHGRDLPREWAERVFDRPFEITA